MGKRNPIAADLRNYRQRVVPDERPKLRERIYDRFSRSLEWLADGGPTF